MTTWDFEDVKKEVSRWAIIAVVGWAGYQIQRMTDALADVATAIEVLKVEKSAIVNRLDKQDIEILRLSDKVNRFQRGNNN